MTPHEEASDTIHDLLVYSDINPTDEAISVCYKNLPSDIRFEGEYWGWSDTLVRELIYKFINDSGRSLFE